MWCCTQTIRSICDRWWWHNFARKQLQYPIKPNTNGSNFWSTLLKWQDPIFKHHWKKLTQYSQIGDSVCQSICQCNWVKIKVRWDISHKLFHWSLVKLLRSSYGHGHVYLMLVSFQGCKTLYSIHSNCFCGPYTFDWKDFLFIAVILSPFCGGEATLGVKSTFINICFEQWASICKHLWCCQRQNASLANVTWISCSGLFAANCWNINAPIILQCLAIYSLLFTLWEYLMTMVE